MRTEQHPLDDDAWLTACGRRVIQRCELAADQERALAETIARDGERVITEIDRICDWLIAALCVLAAVVIVVLLRAEHAHGDRPLLTINEVINK